MSDALRAEGNAYIQTPSEARFRGLTPRSRVAFAATESIIPAGTPGGLAQGFPHAIFAQRADGCHLWDADGRRLLDLMNGDWLFPTGHATPGITKAISNQLSRGSTFSIPDADLGREMATRLRDRIPSMERMRFTTSGTEATMFAMRLARAFTGRAKIAKVYGGYHGTNDVAMVGNGHHREPSEVPAGLIPGVADQVVLIPYNNAEGAASIILENAEDLAAVIIEPMLGAAGMIPATKEYLQKLRDVTESLGILLIFDEIVTFTLSYGGAQSWYGIRPDLTTLGKAIGGGLPLAAFGGRSDVMDLVDPYRNDQFPPVRHGSTTGGIPICLAAGIAVLDILDEDSYAKLHKLGDQLRSGVRKIADRLGLPLQVTGLGHFFGLHWTPDEVHDFRPSPREEVRRIVVGLYNEGFLMFTNGAGVASTPMTSDDIADFVAALPAAIEHAGL